MIARVIFNLPIDRAFDYTVPDGWPVAPQPGMRVLAPFGRRRMIGAILELPSKSPVKELKSLLRLLDPRPVLSPEAFELGRWIAEYYCCSLGQACSSMVPGALRVRRPIEAAASASVRQDGPTLTAEQQQACDAIATALAQPRPTPLVLHGVTGSGKTELYLRSIRMVVEAGGSAVVLVPEIALTPQTIDRFRERFGAGVALWHSRLTARQRAAAWQRMAQGDCRIVVGTRSAVFAPVAGLRLIVLDEEHDASYKQDQAPRYHAREVAIARADLAGALVILGSATPSVESYYAARTGRFGLLRLTQRVEGRALPRVEIVDMREEFGRSRRLGPFSERLAIALRQVVELKEQAILLLNRRGFARVSQCTVCGVAIRCADCAVPMIYHATATDADGPAPRSQSPGRLLCHYCNARQEIPETCPACQKGYLRLRGAGTERIESELHRLFPASGIGRMDADTTRKRESHRRLYELIKTQQLDLLVGTQMLAKGLDIPQVTLVGVVSADTALNLPDFRAGERTFDLLTQVAGRAGRGDRPGRVLVQTFCPTHYAIQAASRHDYEAFYRQEITSRERLGLPPFSHLIELTVSGDQRSRVQRTAERLAERLGARRGAGRMSVLGPAPHRIARLRGQYRWHLVLKGRTVAPMVASIRSVVPASGRFEGLPVTVDVDPL